MKNLKNNAALQTKTDGERGWGLVRLSEQTLYTLEATGEGGMGGGLVKGTITIVPVAVFVSFSVKKIVFEPKT